MPTGTPIKVKTTAKATAATKKTSKSVHVSDIDIDLDVDLKAGKTLVGTMIRGRSGVDLDLKNCTFVPIGEDVIVPAGKSFAVLEKDEANAFTAVTPVTISGPVIFNIIDGVDIVKDAQSVAQEEPKSSASDVAMMSLAIGILVSLSLIVFSLIGSTVLDHSGPLLFLISFPFLGYMTFRFIKLIDRQLVKTCRELIGKAIITSYDVKTSKKLAAKLQAKIDQAVTAA